MFSENLNFLMNITGVKASELGRACHLNASHISRLRNGTRPLPKRPAFLHDMSLYLAKHINEDYRRDAIRRKLKLPSYPADDAAAAEIIEKWLKGCPESYQDAGAIIARFTAPRSDPPAAAEEEPLRSSAGNCFYGPLGKQEAVLRFFDTILTSKEPRTLLLSSDEEMDWLYEDPAFADKWKKSFTRVLMAGNRVKIIHSLGRKMNEMLEAITKWIPLYMTGKIEPYYYPRLRDGIYQRTVFIAEGLAAVVSVSVDRQTEGMLNEFITGDEALEALSLEFNNYFALCRPLMRIITTAERQDLWSAYDNLQSAEGSAICMSSLPTLVTMPEKTALSMQKRAPESIIYERWKKSAEFAKRIGKDCKYTEMILSPAVCLADNSPSCSRFMGAEGIRYTNEEWQEHLESMTVFAEKCPHYRLIIRDDIPLDINLFVKEGRGVIMTKDSKPGIAFAFSEANLVSSFWDYLIR